LPADFQAEVDRVLAERDIATTVLRIATQQTGGFNEDTNHEGPDRGDHRRVPTVTVDMPRVANDPSVMADRIIETRAGKGRGQPACGLLRPASKSSSGQEAFSIRI
jgi:hypothetical protein